MMRSLRSRLILGMFVGMTLLLVVAGVALYTVQRQQLYRAFDETLLNSAKAVTLLVHPGPFGNWFDADGLARLPAGQIRQGAVFQIWSDQPIDRPPKRPGRADVDDEEATSRPWEGERPPREPLPMDWERGIGPEGPRGMRPPPGREPWGAPPPIPLEEMAEEWRRHAPGERVIRSDALGEADLPRLNAPAGRPWFDWMTLPDGTAGRAVELQIELGVRRMGPRPGPSLTLITVVAASTAETEKQLGFLAMLLVATAVGTLGVCGGVAWLVVSRSLRPLDTVARKIAAMDETGLKARIVEQGVPREIGPVVHQLNALLGRLDAAFERERALTADVAHELRTPVAELRAIAEVTMSRRREPPEYQQALGEMVDAVKTLQELIEKLLVLARLEAGQVQPELTAIPLKPLVVEHWALVHAAATARGVTLEERCPVEVCVAADPKLLDVALANVLSNAAAYAPAGSAVVVEGRGVGEQWEVSIANGGCPLDADEVERVFERFWRADTARSKTGLNCGLGLTLVRRAMEAMGGQARASVNEGGGFVLTLTFAAAEVT